jgi:hypothetical protein
VKTKPGLQKILKGLLHIKEQTKVKQIDSRKYKQGIGKTKQGTKNDSKQQALLSTNTECKLPQCPNQETQNSKLE